MMGSVALLRRGRDTWALSPPREDTVRRWPCEARKGVLTRTHQAGTQVSEFQPPELREINLKEINLRGLSHPVYGTVLWRPDWTNTISHMG